MKASDIKITVQKFVIINEKDEYYNYETGIFGELSKQCMFLTKEDASRVAKNLRCNGLKAKINKIKISTGENNE